MIKTLNKRILVLVLVLLSFGFARTQESSTGWDNQVYLGNKVAFGKNKWKFSGELQVRLRDNFQQLDNWYFEFVSTYLISEHFEIVPDFRFTIKPDKLEWRPGFGVLYKYNAPRIQFVNQVKWQIDIPNHGEVGNALREVVFLNHQFNEKIVSTLIAGFIYRWRPSWNGFQYIRVGPGVSFIFDEKHILNFSYFVGVENNSQDWLWAGIPMLQLVINLNKSDKYTFRPAYYFDF